MEKKFTDFYEAYMFLCNHPMVTYKERNFFSKCLDIEVVKVNPKTNEIDLYNKENNTKTEIWLEFGPILKDEDYEVIPAHDYELDTGADTFEDAVVNLANLVWYHYGNSRTPITEEDD